MPAEWQRALEGRPACSGASSTRRAAGACCCRGAGGACTASSASSTAGSAFAAASTCSTTIVDPNHGALEQPRFDFAVRVTGPLVADAHETMTRLWLRLQAAREARHFDFAAALATVRRPRRAGTDADDPQMSAERPEPAPPPPAAPGLLAGLVLRDNLRFRKRIEHFYRYAIAQARSEILIANAYFVPGVALQRALLRAAERGVKVTLLLQGRYEYFMQHHTSRAMYGVLLAPASRSSNTRRASCTPRWR